MTTKRRPPPTSKPQRYKAPFPPFERGDAFHDLRRLMRSKRRPIVLVGAGASVGSGYPDWPTLLTELRKASGVKMQKVWRRNLENLGDAPWTAEVFARKFAAGQLKSFIADIFGKDLPLAEPHLTLARLRFSHYLTTNYDGCIERALKGERIKHLPVHWSDGPALSAFLLSLSDPLALPRVVHLHGAHDSPDEKDIILRERDYVSRYVRDDDARRKLMAIFMTQPIVFVGFSMNDPDLANLMREVTSRLDRDRPSHFALMAYKGEEEREVTRDRMTSKFGVRPLFFSRTPANPAAGEFHNLLLLLDALDGAPAKPRVLPPKPDVTTLDPDDPNLGRFGRSAEASGRRLSVQKLGGSQADGSLHLEFILEALPGSPRLEGSVTFHLHPTFAPSVVSVRAVPDGASIDRWAYGAFTVGAEADEGHTRLELDLSALASLPLWFRRQ